MQVSGPILILCLVALQATAAEREIVVGGELGYAPYEFVDGDGQARGFNPDLLRAIGREMDLDVRFDLGTWPTRRLMIETGEIDVLAMFVSSYRRRQVDFVTPHLIAYHRIFVHADGPEVETLEELAGRRVIVQRAAYSHDWVRHASLDIEPVLVGDETEALRLLATGEYDAALLTEHRSRRIQRDLHLDNVVSSGPPVLPVEYALAVAPGNRELAEILETGLERVRASGEFDRIVRTWLEPDASINRMVAILKWTTLIAIAVGLLAAAWVLALRRTVAARTSALRRELESHRRTTRALTESEREARTTFEQAAAGMARVDLDGRWLQVNRRMCTILETEAESLAGNPLTSSLHADDERWLKQAMKRLRAHNGGAARGEIRFRTLRGAGIWARVSLSLVLDTDDRPRHFVLVAQDVTEARRLSDELDYLARHDELTGLANRSELERHLAAILADPGDSGEERAHYGLLHVNQDHFRLVIEKFDHAGADDLIRQIARRIRMLTDSGDLPARIGGDDFAILVRCRSRDEILEQAERLRQGIARAEFRVHGQAVRATVSVGVRLSSGGEDAVEILKCADAACFHAREQGGNRVCLHREGDRALYERRGQMRWVGRIEAALAEDRLLLYFQNIRALREPEGIHVEVLLRMQAPDGSMVAASRFLPAAERYGLTPRLDRWVVSRLCQWLHRHHGDLAPVELVSFNLSGRSLGDPGLLTFLQEQIVASGYPPGRLCIEITESALIANLAAARESIRMLRGMGCRFALDDFGVGHSSMAYLRELPVEYLKIDGSFCRDIVDNPLDQAMLAEINDLGHVLGKITVAEHVESEQALRELERIGVDMAQGFFIARPRPLEELVDECRQAAGRQSGAG